MSESENETPDQPSVLQGISNDWKNRDREPESNDEGDPNTRSEQPEEPAVAAAPVKTTTRRQTAKTETPEG